MFPWNPIGMARCLLMAMRSERFEPERREKGGWSMRTLEHVSRYREMWLVGVASCPAAVGNRHLTNDSFCARHHAFRRHPGWSGAREHGVFINETFESVMECLAYYRWFRIPQRLRALRAGSGVPVSADIEELLDASGYSVSLTVEELFHMLDECLRSGSASPEDLQRMRQAYNGIGGFDEPTRAEIVCWGPVGEVLADSSLQGSLDRDGAPGQGLRALLDTGRFDPGNRRHILAADRFLRRTSAV